jgi:hypothetical protein
MRRAWIARPRLRRTSPSLRRFTLALSSRMGFAGWSFAVGYLGPRHPYVLDTEGGRLWASTFPTKPPTSQKQ